MKLWKTLLVAFAAMCAQDILSTCMVIAESRLDPVLAGSLDAAGWLFGLICSALAIESIIQTGWRTKRSLAIISAVTLANFAGTYAGVVMGAALTRH